LTQNNLVLELGDKEYHHTPLSDLYLQIAFPSNKLFVDGQTDIQMADRLY